MLTNQQSSSEGETGTGEINQQQPPTLLIKTMLGFLYFVQGFVLAIPSTMPYVYPTLPNYLILSLFSMATLPFSFKFATAPLLERYSSLRYGKRKTWIIISQILTNLCMFVCAYLTQAQSAQIFAMMCFLMCLGVSIQDISLDALCLKELRNPKLMSMIQAACQSSGIIFGGLVLLKGTSLQFAKKIGLSDPITTPQTILMITAVCILISSLMIHFQFAEHKVASDNRSQSLSICRVYSIYRYFLKKEYRYCRTMVFFLLCSQGFKFFTAGYDYELIHHGFSRDTLNTIENFQNIVITLLVFLLGLKSMSLSFKKSFLVIQTAELLLSFIVWAFFPTALFPIIVALFLSKVLSQWRFLVSTALCAYFPETGTTGMLYTMNASSANLGNNAFIQTALLKQVPWKTASIIGLMLQIPLIFVVNPKLLDLVENGQTSIQIVVINKEDQAVELNANKEGINMDNMEFSNI